MTSTNRLRHLLVPSCKRSILLAGWLRCTTKPTFNSRGTPVRCPATKNAGRLVFHCPRGQTHRTSSPKKIPSTASPAQWDSIDVDVFFVHPTMYFRGDHWNAHLDNDQVNRDTEDAPMRAQASAFQHWRADVRSKVSASPHWSPSHGKTAQVWAALELAYEDVRSAFVHYLEHWNHGRDIILAGHSQGSWHLRWLLQEFFDGKPLQEQLITAYGPGFDWYASDFDHIPFCEAPEQSGCVCSWMSYGSGYFPPWLANKPSQPMCVHPITWDRQTW